MFMMCVFVFSSRRRHTRSYGDWSSDVCSSDLTIFTRTSVLGRLVAFAIAGGVLAAAMVIPVVAATGVLVRNQADKFTTLSLSSAGLPQRSQILDRYGHLLAYVYGVDAPYDNNNLHYFGWNREPVGYDQISPNMTNAVVAIEDSRYWQP